MLALGVGEPLAGMTLNTTLSHGRPPLPVDVDTSTVRLAHAPMVAGIVSVTLGTSGVDGSVTTMERTSDAPCAVTAALPAPLAARAPAPVRMRRALPSALYVAQLVPVRHRALMRPARMVTVSPALSTVDVLVAGVMVCKITFTFWLSTHRHVDSAAPLNLNKPVHVNVLAVMPAWFVAESNETVTYWPVGPNCAEYNCGTAGGWPPPMMVTAVVVFCVNSNACGPSTCRSTW